MMVIERNQDGIIKGNTTMSVFIQEEFTDEQKKVMERKSKYEKCVKVRKLFFEVDFPPMMIQFFDLYSDELLDEKIEVLTALKERKQISEIPNFYDILELYPKDGEHWD